jgi:hypothetical protein
MPIVHSRNDDFYQPLRLQYARSPTPPNDKDSEFSAESDTLLPPNAHRPPKRPKKRRIRTKNRDGNRRIYSRRTYREAI